MLKSTIFWIYNFLFHYYRGRIKQRLGLYHSVMPIYMQFSNDAEETFARALKLLLVSDISPIACIFLFLMDILLNVGKSFLHAAD